MTTIIQNTENPNIFKFADKCTYNFLELEISENKKSTWINSHYVDPDNCKLFIILLKSAFEKMKSMGCTNFEQIVTKEDWLNFLNENKEWEVIKTYSDFGGVPAVAIKCNIDIAHELVVDGFLRNNKTF